jgi:outer membrane protein with beta-barrel domain
MKFAAASATILLTFMILTTVAFAQNWNRLDFSAGGGFSSPTNAASNSLNTGWNLDFRGGYNVNRHFAADLDVNYNYWGLNSAALAQFGEPGGNVSVWSFAFQPVIRVLPRRSAANAYTTGGFGIDYRNLTLTRPTTVTTIICDPFFGCFPATFTAEQVVASFSTAKPGFNAGGGFEVRLGESRTRAFAEARYQRMFTTHGEDLTYVPVTFGLRW